MDAQRVADERNCPEDELLTIPRAWTVTDQIEALRALRARAVADRLDLIHLQRRLIEQQRQILRWQRDMKQGAQPRPVARPEAPPADAEASPAQASDPVASTAGTDGLPAEAQPPLPLSDLLTARETEVLHMLARGQTNREIGSALGITHGTAKIHVEHILAKLRARSRAHAASKAVRLGLLATAEAAVRPPGTGDQGHRQL